MSEIERIERRVEGSQPLHRGHLHIALNHLYAQINDEEHQEGPVYEALKKAIEVLASLCHAIEADKMRRQIEDSVRQSAEAQERLTALESK